MNEKLELSRGEKLLNRLFVRLASVGPAHVVGRAPGEQGADAVVGRQVLGGDLVLRADAQRAIGLGVLIDVLQIGREVRRPARPRDRDPDVLDLRVDALDLQVQVLFQRAGDGIVDGQLPNRSGLRRRDGRRGGLRGQCLGADRRRFENGQHRRRREPRQGDPPPNSSVIAHVPDTPTPKCVGVHLWQATRSKMGTAPRRDVPDPRDM